MKLVVADTGALISLGIANCIEISMMKLEIRN
jgi:hypothetical protein